MARVAKASKSTKSVPSPRKPGRSLTVTAANPIETRKTTLSKLFTAAAPIEKRESGRPAKGSIIAPTISTRAPKTATGHDRAWPGCCTARSWCVPTKPVCRIARNWVCRELRGAAWL